MKGIATTLILIVFSITASLPAQQESYPELDQLLSSKELEKYRRDSRYKERMEVFADALRRYTVEFQSNVDQKRIDDLLLTLRKVTAIAYHALQEPPPADRKQQRAGEVRKLEIRIRKLLQDIRDAKTLAPYEYHSEFDRTIQELSQLRSRLLDNMFNIGKRSERAFRPNQPLTSHLGGPDLAFLPAARYSGMPSSIHRPNRPLPLAAAALAATQDESRYSGQVAGDQFTEAEFVKVQNNQDLVKRVDIFLEIAESRLKEIRRRLNNEAWKEKEANPLEFYTLEQMVHAYDRALNSTMVNIDEKVKYKLVKPKDVKKVLEKLNSKVVEFTPQLQPVKESAVKNNDAVLYREVVEAEKTTEIARKGSLYGLGAPAK